MILVLLDDDNAVVLSEIQSLKQYRLDDTTTTKVYFKRGGHITVNDTIGGVIGRIVKAVETHGEGGE